MDNAILGSLASLEGKPSLKRDCHDTGSFSFRVRRLRQQGR
jgi:hypothetical protein